MLEYQRRQSELFCKNNLLSLSLPKEIVGLYIVLQPCCCSFYLLAHGHGYLTTLNIIFLLID